jgi:hypothetical protein
MELKQNLGDRDRLTRTLLTVGLAVFALWSFRNGKRMRGVLAGLGAFALGYGASTDSGGVRERLADSSDTEPTSGVGQLRCAICGDPIVAGQSRTPNENNEIVHETCLKAPA